MLNLDDDVKGQPRASGFLTAAGRGGRGRAGGRGGGTAGQAQESAGSLRLPGRPPAPAPTPPRSSRPRPVSGGTPTLPTLHTSSQLRDPQRPVWCLWCQRLHDRKRQTSAPLLPESPPINQHAPGATVFLVTPGKPCAWGAAGRCSLTRVPGSWHREGLKESSVDSSLVGCGVGERGGSHHLLLLADPAPSRARASAC